MIASVIAHLLSSDGYIQVNKVLIKTLGLHSSVLMGELCAEYCYWQTNNKLEDDMFFSTIENITENTGLTEHEQRQCVKELKQLGILTVCKKGLPAKNYFKINFEQLSDTIMSSGLKIQALDVENLNLNNNKEININNNTLSKDKESKPKKKTRYDSCLEEITKRYSDEELINVLVTHLNSICGGLCGVNQWKGMLNQLDKLKGDKVAIVNQSISSGWFKFYELNNSGYTKNTVSNNVTNKNVNSVQYTEEQRQKEQEIRERREQNGERICF